MIKYRHERKHYFGGGLMSENKALYFCTIKREADEKAAELYNLSGVVKNLSDNKEFKFNPTIALCDLLDPSVYDENAGRLPKGHTKHPFFMGREYQGEDDYEWAYRFSLMLYAIDSLKEIISRKKLFSFSELELAKMVFNLKFTNTMEFKEKNIMFELGLKHNLITGEELEEQKEYDYISIGDQHYNYNFNWDELFEAYENNAFISTYTCYSIKDIMFSVLHYLMVHRYKFRQCEHCGKFFATTTEKNKYCNRKSPYKGYGKFNSFEHIECEQAVRNIRQEIRREKNRIDDYICAMDRNYNTGNSFVFNEQCINYEKQINKHYTVDNLKGYEKLLSKCRRQAGMRKGRLPNKHI